MRKSMKDCGLGHEAAKKDRKRGEEEGLQSGGAAGNRQKYGKFWFSAPSPHWDERAATEAFAGRFPSGRDGITPGGK
jgi:hypothetical protein